MLRRAVELGVNLIDTADSYGPEVSENLIAEALHPYPDGLVIATKGGLARTGPGRVAAATRGRSTCKECCEGACGGCGSTGSTSTSCTRPTRRCRSRTRSARSRRCRTRARSATSACRTSPSTSSSGRAAIVDVVTVQNRYNLADRALGGRARGLRARRDRVHPLVPAGHRRPARAGRAARRVAARPRRDAGADRARLAARPLAGRCCRSPAPPRSRTSRRTSPPPSSSSSRRSWSDSPRPPDSTDNQGVNEPPCSAAIRPHQPRPCRALDGRSRAARDLPLRPPRACT